MRNPYRRISIGYLLSELAKTVNEADRLEHSVYLVTANGELISQRGVKFVENIGHASAARINLERAPRKEM